MCSREGEAGGWWEVADGMVSGRSRARDSLRIVTRRCVWTGWEISEAVCAAPLPEMD